MEFIYPRSDFDNARAMLSVLGSFWARTYTNRDQVESYILATAEHLAQTQLNLLETIAALSRYTVPVFHVANWVPITLKKSEMNTGLVGLLRFDESGQFDDGRARLDRPVSRPYYAFPRPAKLVGAAQIFNKLIFPTVALAEKVDFFIDLDRDALVFTANPFESAAFMRRSRTGWR